MKSCCSRVAANRRQCFGRIGACVAIAFVGVLQRVAVCCSVLQCVAVCCSVLQCAAVCYSELQCALQCVAVCCSVFQNIDIDIQMHRYIYIYTHTYIPKNTLPMVYRIGIRVAVCYSVLQCVAECCSIYTCAPDKLPFFGQKDCNLRHRVLQNVATC